MDTDAVEPETPQEAKAEARAFMRRQRDPVVKPELTPEEKLEQQRKLANSLRVKGHRTFDIVEVVESSAHL